MVKAIRKFINFFSMQSKATAAYLICNIILKSVSFFTFPIFARLLSLEDFGLVSMYASYMGFVSIFTSLYLQYGTFSTAMVKFENDKDGYLASASGFLILLTSIYLIIMFIFGNTFSNLLNISKFLLILMGIDSLCGNIVGVFIARERFDYKYKVVVFITLIVFFVGIILGLILVLNMEDRGIARILSTASINIVLGIIILFIILSRSNKLYNKEYFHYIISFNIPLLPYYFSQLIFGQSDRIMIDKMVGRDSVALYEVGNKLATVVIVVLNSINSTFVPWVFRSIKNNNFEKIRFVSKGIAVGLASILLILILIYPEALNLLFGDKYTGSLYVIPPIAMSLLFQYFAQLFINVDFYCEEKLYLVISSFLSAIVNIVLNYLFIPRFGFVVAAWTTLISYIIFALCGYITMNMAKKKHNIENNIYDIKFIIIQSIVFLTLCTVVSIFYDYTIVRLAILILCFIFIIIQYKKIYNLFIRYVELVRNKE